MCDKGCEVLFRAQDCVVKSSTTGKTLLKGVRRESNVYIVKEEDEACHLSKLRSHGYGIGDWDISVSTISLD